MGFAGTIPGGLQESDLGLEGIIPRVTGCQSSGSAVLRLLHFSSGIVSSVLHDVLFSSCVP